MKKNPEVYDCELVAILNSRQPKTTGRKIWSTEEKRLFDEAVLRFGKEWTLINEHVNTKTLRQVCSHALGIQRDPKYHQLQVRNILNA